MSLRLARSSLAVAAVGLAAALSGCAIGPADETELCTSFDKLGTELLNGNVGFHNPLFRAADSLGDVAERYTATNLSADAKALHDIADSDSTDGNELRNASMHIANICGHPLGLGQSLTRG